MCFSFPVNEMVKDDMSAIKAKMIHPWLSMVFLGCRYIVGVQIESFVSVIDKNLILAVCESCSLVLDILTIICMRPMELEDY